MTNLDKKESPMTVLTIDYSKITNIEFDDVDYGDYPDFCDACISYAEDENGDPLSDAVLDYINDTDFVYESLMEHLF